MKRLKKTVRKALIISEKKAKKNGKTLNKSLFSEAGYG
jgi:hypothetical protein